MILKRLNKNIIYSCHILLTNGNELHITFVSNKSKEDIPEIIKENLSYKVTIDKIYQISTKEGIEFIDRDVLNVK